VDLLPASDFREARSQVSAWSDFSEPLPQPRGGFADGGAAAAVRRQAAPKAPRGLRAPARGIWPSGGSFKSGRPSGADLAESDLAPVSRRAIQIERRSPSARRSFRERRDP